MLRKKTIWIKEQEPDTYVEFTACFKAKVGSDIHICIGCDSCAAVYINDTLAFFGSGADYPWHRLYYRADITRYCNESNDIRILVWYCGVDSQTYIKGEAGLAFLIEQDEKILLESSPEILSRKQTAYRNGYCKTITNQMGFSFYYDSCQKNEEPFLPSIESEKEKEFHLRKTGYLTLGNRVPVCYTRMPYGYLIDMQEEQVGFLELDFDSSCEQELLITYGEHLVEGNVLRKIGERDFSVEYKTSAGTNRYLNPFRRLAGRYLQVFCKEELDIRYIGIRPTNVSVVKEKRTFEDSLFQKIYDVSVNTLEKCMHEHYEDCPWREQAMYTLDSRNQMLCGYFAFQDKNVDYAKENLLFIAKGQRKDGLLSLCFPAGSDIPIPFFSLVYMMQVSDYVRFTGDEQTAKLVRPVLDKIYRTFSDRIDGSGLIPNFSYPCWNFYEWSKDSHNEHEITRGSEEECETKYDLILNCMYVYFCQLYYKVYGEEKEIDEMRNQIQETFYDEKAGGYRLSTNGSSYSQLGNSFVILIGLGNQQLAEKMIKEKSWIEVTLSMNTFYYDALLTFGDTYHAFILQDMKEKYGYMLEQGATTFWETAKGWKDFDGAGSLCHGWSAIPAYYIPMLL